MVLTFTSSSSTGAVRLCIELKLVRDKTHATRVGDELIIDIEHYRRHPQCDVRWCVVLDPQNLRGNAAGFQADLEGPRSTPDGAVQVKVSVLVG